MESEFREFYHVDKETKVETKYRGAWALVNEYLNCWCADFSILNFDKSKKMFDECVADGRFVAVGVVRPVPETEETPVCKECFEEVDCVDDSGLCFNCHGKTPR